MREVKTQVGLVKIFRANTSSFAQGRRPGTLHCTRRTLFAFHMAVESTLPDVESTTRREHVEV